MTGELNTVVKKEKPQKPPEPELYPFQEQFKRDLRVKIRGGNTKIACVAPTGSGKTILMGSIIEGAIEKNKKILLIVHLDVLVGQSYEKIAQFVSPDKIGFIKAGWEENPNAPVQIASIQTLQRRDWWREQLNPDLIFFDEAHETSFHQLGKEIIHSIFPHAFILGFTATPWRLSKHESFSDHFQDLVQAPPPGKLQEQGFLCPLEYYSVGNLDLSEVSSNGDFVKKDLEIAVDRPEVIRNAVDNWERICPNRKTIAFCVTIKHAKSVAQEFQNRGYNVEVVSSETPKEERDRLYSSLENGELQVLASVDVVSIGFDRKPIEVGLLLRPTKSLGKHHQQIGRIMRVAPGKEKAIVLDQAGNCLRFGRFGFPEGIEEYSFETPQEKKNGLPPYKKCPRCGRLNLLANKVCDSCEYEFPGKPKETFKGELGKVDPKAPDNDSKEKRKRFFQGKLRQAYQQGYAPGWAFFKFQDRYGVKPSPAWKKLSIFEEFNKDNALLYLGYLNRIAQVKSKDKDWIQREFKAQFGKGQDVEAFLDSKL
jgi:superfamily II DNA or RNA helicase